MRNCFSRIISLLPNLLDTSEVFYVSMSTDGAGIYLSLHVYAADQGQRWDAREIEINNRFVVTKCKFWQEKYWKIYFHKGMTHTECPFLRDLIFRTEIKTQILLPFTKFRRKLDSLSRSWIFNNYYTQSRTGNLKTIKRMSETMKNFTKIGNGHTVSGMSPDRFRK
jgi:hypothetical protein